MHDAAGSRNGVLAATRGLGILPIGIQIIEAKRVPNLVSDHSNGLAGRVYAVIMRLAMAACIDFRDGIDKVVVIKRAGRSGGPEGAGAVVGILLLPLLCPATRLGAGDRGVAPGLVFQHLCSTP